MIPFKEAYECCRENLDSAFLHLEFMRDAYNELERRYKWISVEKKLPKDYETVLGCNCSGEIDLVAVVCWHDSYGWHDNLGDDEDHDDITITHWQPLPDPPKASNDNCP
jgi:hypothetical protein